MARRRKRYRAKLNWVVILLVSVVAAFCILSSVEDKYGMEIGLPEVELPSLGFLYDIIDDITDDGRRDSKDYMDNAMQVSGPVQGDGVAVHMLSMGQADSFLIVAPESTVLIDAGENGQGPQVIRYLREQGIEKIDIAIGTHPHSDHIGGLDTVLLEVPVERIILPEIPEAITPTTRTYLDLLEAIDTKGLEITPAEPGLRYELGNGAVLTILAPLGEYGDLNNMSVVSRLDYGETSFLFTGDIEAQAEMDLVERAYVQADVMQAPHHGSSTSSTAALVDKVRPGIVLISCGLDNSYGHPHRETLERYLEREVQLCRTDLNGAVVVRSDGSELYITTEK